MACQGEGGKKFCRKNAVRMPGAMVMARARTTVVCVSASSWTESLSKKRRKKWPMRVRVTRDSFARSWLIRDRSDMVHLHDADHVAGDLFSVCLLDELGEDTLECGEL